MKLTMREAARSPIFAALYLCILGRVLGRAAFSIARDRLAGRNADGLPS